MFVIGVVLLVLAVLGAIAAVDVGRDVRVTLDGFGVHSTTSVLWVFCAGALAMLLLLLALAAFRRAGRRRRIRRREEKQLRADEAAAAEAREAELRAEGAREAEARAAQGSTTQTAGTETAPVDVRDAEGAHAYRSNPDDPGPERRYVPGEERVN